MRQLFSRTDLQALSSVLAVVLLLSSLPLTNGVVIVSGSSQPEFAINICRPIHALDRVSNTLLARPAVNVPQFALPFLDLLRATPGARVVERNVAPDTPPPKPFV
jgi:hypothetical protein